MLFKNLVEYSERIGKTSSRHGKIAIILGFLKKLSQRESEIGVNFISGKISQGKLSLASKGLVLLVKIRGSMERPPDLLAIDRALDLAGKAKGRKKVEVLGPLFRRLSAPEKKFLAALISGEVHQGAGEGLVKMAIAGCFGLLGAEIDQAYLQKPDLGSLFAYLLQHGKAGIHRLGISVFHPVKPMLAQITESIDDLANEYRDLSIEYKYDGVRVQVHRKQDRIRIFSRNLKDITIHFPEIADMVRTIPLNEFILDGEAIGVDNKGKPVPFQVLAKRTMRKKNIKKMMAQIPVVPKFFDILYFDKEDLTSKAYVERVRILNEVIIDRTYLVDWEKPRKKGDVSQFFRRSIQAGNEGIMAKLLDAPYRAGKRGKYWFKLKNVYTIDCVILAAEWGHGRREGLLSNLHLGVLDETKTKYLMVGKTFKGLTDEILVWFTEHLPALKVHEDAWTVYVRPHVVVEIAFNEVQKSPKYDSKFALRFARVKRIRKDKSAREINTILDLVKLGRSDD